MFSIKSMYCHQCSNPFYGYSVKFFRVAIEYQSNCPFCGAEVSVYGYKNGASIDSVLPTNSVELIAL